MRLPQNKLLLNYTYVRPPVDGVNTLDWAKFEYLEHLGYDFMHAVIESWAHERAEHTRDGLQGNGGKVGHTVWSHPCLPSRMRMP